MEILLLLIALTFEIMFVIYCIVTKKRHQKLKSWCRLGFFIAFALLTLSSVIVWSFRWVLIGTLLFMLAVKAAFSLIRNKENHNKYKTPTIVWKAIFMVMALVLVFTPAVIFPQHPSPKVTGEYKVETATDTYIDQTRINEFSNNGDNRFINVKYWYPKNADETYPLLVFSHGATGIKSSNTSTFMELASHGYVVVSIDHPYHSFYTVSEDGTRTLIDSDYNLEISNLNNEGVYTNEELFELIQKWMKLRTEDINFVLDTIIEQSQVGSNSVAKLANTEKIGVFGHSMGGAASVWISKKRSDIDAVVNLDAPFFSELDYNKEIDDFVALSDAYTTPLLNIYSDDVWEQLESNSLYVANKLNNEQFQQAYTTHFKGAKHLSFTDLPLVSPILANILQGGKAAIDKYYSIETTNELILEFFDYELKGMGTFNPEETY